MGSDFIDALVSALIEDHNKTLPKSKVKLTTWVEDDPSDKYKTTGDAVIAVVKDGDDVRPTVYGTMSPKEMGVMIKLMLEIAGREDSLFRHAVLTGIESFLRDLADDRAGGDDDDAR